MPWDKLPMFGLGSQFDHKVESMCLRGSVMLGSQLSIKNPNFCPKIGPL